MKGAVYKCNRREDPRYSHGLERGYKKTKDGIKIKKSVSDRLKNVICENVISMIIITIIMKLNELVILTQMGSWSNGH